MTLYTMRRIYKDKTKISNILIKKHKYLFMLRTMTKRLVVQQIV